MSRTSILLVEDDPDHQELLCAVLTGAHPEVRVQMAQTGDEAVEAIRTQGADAFDCILLDFNLPGDDAADVLPRLLEAGCRCPKLVLSSSDEQGVVIRSLRSGGVDFIPKSEAMLGDQLWTRITSALAKWRREEESRRKMVRRSRRLAREAGQDPLTGLSNRRCLERRFADQRDRYDRRGWVAVAMLDLDHFKRINDTYGHALGDRVLCGTADAIKERLGPLDTACRYGGEEFVVIRPVRECAEAVCWADELRKAIERITVTTDDRAVCVSASIGVVTCRSDRFNRETLARADRSMYLAKQRGRNRLCTWDMVVFDEAVRETRPESDAPVEARLRDVLYHTVDRLGPTQQAHLTTHAESVSRMAVRLGEALTMPTEAIERLRLAGQCHDLGMFLTPEEVLGKPDLLSAEERILVARHAGDGADMAAMLGADASTCELIRHHHTWYGDTRFPAVTNGETVSVGARVLSVAEALVTMTSYRRYQPERSFTAAVGELQNGSGEQFDPDVVGAVPRSLSTVVPALRTPARRSDYWGS